MRDGRAHAARLGEGERATVVEVGRLGVQPPGMSREIAQQQQGLGQDSGLVALPLESRGVVYDRGARHDAAGLARRLPQGASNRGGKRTWHVDGSSHAAHSWAR
jgi:hypothetical protein